MKAITAIVVNTLCLLLFAPFVINAGVLEDLNADFIAHFDEGVIINRPLGLSFEKHGNPKIVKNGLQGNALSLLPGQYLIYNDENTINSAEGTIVIWVKPRLDFDGSHTFISLKLLGPMLGYLAISKGWWEPKGSSLTYFIANNQEFAHTNKEVCYIPGKWVQLVCVWRAGDNGYVKLYVNGVLSGSLNKRWLPYPHEKKLFIGTDRGTSLASSRWADCYMDEIAIFKRALTDEEILKIYNEVAQRSFTPIKENDVFLETRAIFDEGVGWLSKKGALDTINRISKAGFNVYIPCVWHGKGVRFPHSKVPAESDDIRKNFYPDPLDRLILLAHEKGIEVHPWFCITLRQRDFLSRFYSQETPDNAFDIHRPEFQNFIVELISYVVKRYDIDGVNIDYIRTMGICHCKQCIFEYNQRFGRDLIKDSALSVKPNGSLESHLQEWQDNAVESVVMKIKNRLKSIRSNIIISVDGAPLLPYSIQQGRREIEWANKGLVDAIFNMDYAEIPDYQRHICASCWLKNTNNLYLLTCNYEKVDGQLRPSDTHNLIKIINYTRNQWNQCCAFYLYSMLSDRQINDLARGPFNYKAIPLWRMCHDSQ